VLSGFQDERQRETAMNAAWWRWQQFEQEARRLAREWLML
jgi:hypothetical protein